jgi:iron complex outermembrane recepter protein
MRMSKAAARANLFGALLSALSTTGFLGTTFAAPPAEAHSVAYDLDIPSQNLNDALQAFALVSRHKLLYSSELVEGKTNPALKGRFTTEEAVKALLSGTHLGYEVTSDGLVLIRAFDQTSRSTAPASIGGDPTGADLAAQEGKKQSSGEFRLAQLDQGKGSSPPSVGDQASSAQENSNRPSLGLSEIVVTAQKITQKLMDVPASITALTGAQLEQIHATQMSDWVGYVPGLNTNTAGAPGMGVLILEGIAPISSASEVGTYVNDVPVGSSSSFGGGGSGTLDLMPYDVDRIEVLRGPEGTLYGASAMGGLVKYVLKSPNPNEFSAAVGGDVLGVKNAGGHGDSVRGAVNIPLVDDHLGLRVSAYDQYTPGYIDNGVTGAKDQNELRQTGGRATLLWSVNSDLSVQASYLYQKIAVSNLAVVALNPTTGQPMFGDLTNDNVRDEPFQQQLRLYDLTLNWELGWARLTSASSYQNFQNNSMTDETAELALYAPAVSVPVLLSDFDYRVDLEKFTQEIRLTSPQEQALKWLAGIFYTHEQASNTDIIYGYDAAGAALTSYNPLEMSSESSIYQEYAAFGDVTYSFTDQFDLTGGLRYAHNNQSFTTIIGGSFLPPSNLPGRSDQGVTTFMVSPNYHLNNNTILYVRVASGYQPGGPNTVFPGVSAPTQFQSSTLIDYQPGLKSTFLDNRASVDLSAFYIDWTKIQILDDLPGQQTTFFVNGGKARSEGLDLSGQYSPWSSLVLGANLNYTDAILTTPVASLNTAAGARLPYIPRWSGSLTAQYSTQIGANWNAFGGGGYRYLGSRLSNAEGESSAGSPVGYTLGSYSLIDLRAGASHGGLTVALYAKNVADKRAYQSPAEYRYNAVTYTPIDIKAPVVQPRTIGISIDQTF